MPGASSVGKVLERVDGEVDRPVAQRLLELGGEEALAADLGQRLAARLRPVAGGHDGVLLAGEARPGRRSRSLTSSVCARGERRAARADGRPPALAACAHRLAGALRGPNSSRIAAATSSTSPEPARCAQADRGLVQELLHESAGEMLDALRRLRVDLAEVAQRRSTSCARIASACRRIDATSGSTSSSR